MKIGALIPVRLKSERLPGKALKDIVGKPVIHHLLDRVFACRFINPENAVVCTTRDPSDDALVEAVEAYGGSVFRGSTDDIIDRFNDAMKQFKFDAVVQVDGDDPLSATEYMDLTMQTLLDDPTLGIVTCSGLPLGTAVKSFTKAAMATVHAHYRTTANDTGFIYYFTKSGLCSQKEINPLSPDHVHDTARLTLDYPEDLEVFEKIFEALKDSKGPPSLAETVKYLNDHPEVACGNQHLDETYWQRTSDLVKLNFVDLLGEGRVIGA
jgi:spore coat polysaccharide biosynthesis protein SpsF (cytidylyltransferase family)